MKNIFPFLFLLAVPFLSCTENSAEDIVSGINQGKVAPNFTYTSLNDIEITLSDLKGKVVYIFFFGANQSLFV